MPELPIGVLLAALDDEVEPDPAFDRGLRRRLEADLRRPGEAGAARGQASVTPLEVVEMELTRTEDDAASNRWWIVAAAAALAVAVVGAVAVSRGGDDGTAPIAEDPEVTIAATERSFASAELETARIDDGGNPYWVAAAGDVWILSLEGDLTRLDAGSFEPTGRLALSESSAIAAGAGGLWVADALSGEVHRIDPLEVGIDATIPTGIGIDAETGRPLGVAQAMGPARSMARIGGIAASDDAVWVGDHDGRLLLIDPDADVVTREIDIDVRPDVVRVHDETLLAGDLGSGSVVVLDATTGAELARLDVERLVDADLHRGAAFVLDGTAGVVTRIDLATGAVATSAPLGASTSVAGQPIYDAGLVVGDGGVLVETDEGLFVLDPLELTRDGELEIEGTGGEMTIDPDGSAWVVRYSSRTVTQVSPSEVPGG